MAPSRSVVAERDTTEPPHLRILHFNDVYHCSEQSRDPVGGIARFQTLCDYYRNDAQFAKQPKLLTLFSGDCFSPSLEATVFKGQHMVPFLNSLRVDAACVGNHDLDFGIPQYQKLVKQCNFPWLLSNILNQDGDGILADSPPTHLITTAEGVKVGLVGIAEQEWISTVSSLPADLPFVSASESATKYAAQLRAQGADMVIALCHQREVNDNRLAAEVAPGTLDLILAGHDHDHRYSKINGCHILCSGSDFKQLSHLQAWRKNDGKGWDFDIVLRDVTKDIEEDQATLQLMDKLFASFRTKLQKPIGFTTVPLDARFETIRKAESNYANFVCDLLRNHYDADCAIIVGGTFRADVVYTPGIIRINDVVTMFPFEDPEVVLSTPGRAIWDALEHAVSSYPSLEGRFPQISNIELCFDPEKAPGKRLRYVNIGGQPLDKEHKYKLVTRAYTVSGGDGFKSLLPTEKGGQSTWIIDEEHGGLTSTILRQYFMSLKVIGKWKNWSPSLHAHWSHVNRSLHKSHPVRPATPRTPSIASTSSSPLLTKRRRIGSLASTAEVMIHGDRQGEAYPAPPLILPVPMARQKTNPNALRIDTPDRPEDHEDDPQLNETDSESDDDDVPPVPDDAAELERRLIVARRTIKKWRRICGFKHTPGLCDAMAQGVCWTQGIAPAVTGRIRIVGVNA